MQNAFLIDEPINTYTDALTKLGSALERISKVGDVSKLSIEEVMKLLQDYPELLGSIEAGTLDAGTALQILESEFDETRKQLSKDLSSTATKYSIGPEKELMDKGFEGTNIFAEGNEDLLRNILNAGKDSFEETYKESLGDS